MKLGQILIKKRLISPQDLQQTDQMQSQVACPLGELLQQQGMLTDNDLDRALQEQTWQRQGYWVID
jgi:hypothetical protein